MKSHLELVKLNLDGIEKLIRGLHLIVRAALLQK
jgi:hypothetical protein